MLKQPTQWQPHHQYTEPIVLSVQSPVNTHSLCLFLLTVCYYSAHHFSLSLSPSPLSLLHTHTPPHSPTHTHRHATGECGVARGVCICLPASFHKSSRYASMGPCVCVCVCVGVCEREGKRERQCVCVCVCSYFLECMALLRFQSLS